VDERKKRATETARRFCVVLTPPSRHSLDLVGASLLQTPGNPGAPCGFKGSEGIYDL